MKSSVLKSDLTALADLTAEIRRTAEVVRRKRRTHSDTAPGTAMYINTHPDTSHAYNMIVFKRVKY